MDSSQVRGRSPSAGHGPNRNISHSPSPQRYPNQSLGLGLDPSITTATFSTGVFNSNIHPPAGVDQYNLSASYLDAGSQPQLFQPPTLPSNSFPDEELGQSYKQNGISPNGHQGPSQLSLQRSGHQFAQDFVGPFQSRDAGGKPEQSFENGFMLDPNLQPGNGLQGQSINPADIMSNMSSPHGHLSTPPTMMRSESQSSPRPSPGLQQGQFYSPHHSRHNSLDPATASFTQGSQPADWTGMLGGASFQQHRRAPSEHSDVSSSVAPSPFLSQQDNFEQFDQNHSPMLNPQQDSGMYQDALGMEQFTLSDVQQQQQQRQRSGSLMQSPYVSPRMSSQQGLGAQENPFVPTHGLSNQFNGVSGPEMYSSPPDPEYSNYQRRGSTDMGQAAQMVPPEINVELAPPSKQQMFEPLRKENDLDALSPPERGRRNRNRAVSDPFGTSISRPMSPADTSPNLISTDANQRNRSLSPFDSSFPGGLSRSASPSKSPRRQSTSSISDRDYILDLADPTRPSASGDNSKRVQKHPATFQCTLCPKRFTRAYNLRSHLRTHTDERPFVCTVCGKAFARQHDRKRHEGLHSGEKKFVCRGELGAGGQWGCGRRFARADALGRHFRSEAGRICIKPLLDEEALERQRIYDEQIMAGQQGLQQPGLQAPGSVGMQAPGQVMDLNGGGFTLPAALLAQYPALQGLQWDQLGAGSGPGDEGELSGRSSFDASSGGDYFEDEEGSGYVSGPGSGYGNPQVWNAGGGHEWASDYEGR